MVELMLVVAIISLLSAISLPLYADALRNSRRRAMLVDAREFHSAMSRYQIDEGHYPPEATFDRKTLEPLISGDYYTNANTFLGRLKEQEIALYAAPDVGGADTQYFSLMVTDFEDDPTGIVIADTNVIGSLGRLSGVYLSKGSGWIPAEQVW